MRAYIAGPMRGYKHFNFPAFDQATACLRSEGVDVVSPAEHDREHGFDETKETLDGFDMKAALAWDLEQVVNADAVVLLPGWEDSVGARAEKAASEAARVPIMVFTPPTEEHTWTVVPLEDHLASVKLRVVPAEVRVTDPTTGGQKGKKPARFDLIPSGPLWKVAELYGKGAEKYEDHNWRKGYAWSLSYAALNRHLHLFWQGEDVDAETGCPHLTSVVFHAFALLQFGVDHPELDDRPR